MKRLLSFFLAISLFLTGFPVLPAQAETVMEIAEEVAEEITEEVVEEVAEEAAEEEFAEEIIEEAVAEATAASEIALPEIEAVKDDTSKAPAPNEQPTSLSFSVGSCKTSYLLGTDLDLTGGILIIRYSNGMEFLPVTDPSVTVSGYDKDVPGPQTITVSYMGLTTEFTVIVYTYSGSCGSDLDWSFDEDTGTLTITGSGDMYDYNYDSVPWISYADKVLAVELPEGLTSLSKYAFRFCNMTEIHLPEGITSIPDSALEECHSLTTVTIPSTVKYIGQYAFSGSRMSSLQLPEGLETIDNYAFMSCINLEEINLPESLQTLGGGAFYYCGSLPTVSLPDSLDTISWFTFNGCTSLQEITIPKTVTEISYHAFADCTGMNNVRFEGGAPKVTTDDLGGSYPFSNVTSNACYPDNEVSWNTANLADFGGDLTWMAYSTEDPIPVPPEANPTSGTCGDNLTWTFEESSGTLTISGTGKMYDYDVMADDNPSPWTRCSDQIQNLVIESGVTSIGSSAFFGHEALTNVTIGKDVASISPNAFAGCKKLSTLTIPDGVTHIYSCAFYDCTALKRVTIPGTVTEIIADAFEECVNLRDIYFDGSKTAWGRLDFSEMGLHSATVHFISSGTCGENLTWNFDADTGTLTISGSGDMENYGPDHARPWDDYSADVQQVVVKEGVTGIGANSFSSCDALTSVTVPSSVTEIRENAFFGCDAMENIHYAGSSEQWEAIDGHDHAAAEGVTVHTRIVGTCGENLTWNFDADTGTLTVSGEGAIPYQSNSFPWADFEQDITNIVLEQGVTSIGNYAFRNCTSLKSITIPLSVTALYEYSLPGKTVAVDIYYSGNVTQWEAIYGYGYAETTNKTVHLTPAGAWGDNVTWVFDEDTGKLTVSGTGDMDYFGSYNRPWERYEDAVTEVVIESGITSIASSAFEYFDALTTVTIPLSVEYIDTDAFYPYNNLTDIYYAGNYSQWIAIGGDGKPTSYWVTIHRTPEGTCGDNLSWVFDEDTGTLTISGEGKMTSFTYESVTATTHNHPWEELTPYITSVVLEEGITGISAYAFYKHSALTTVTLGKDIASIGSRAFEYCKALTAVYLPASVTTIDSFAFNNCPALTDIYYAGNYSQWEAITGNGKPSSSDFTIHKTPAGVCGENVTWAFDKDTGTLTISGEGDMIDFAYTGKRPWDTLKDSITGVVIEKGITRIGNYAFYNYSGLTAVTIGPDVTSIGQSAFYGCAGLNGVTIPDNVTTLDAGVFSNCDGLTSITISAKITTIPSSAFYNCDGLTTLTIPGNVTTISSRAFYDCDSLTTVTLKEGVNTLEVAFSNCDQLTTVYLPASVTSLNSSFSDCPALKDIYYAGNYSQWETISYHYQVEQEGITIHKQLSGTCNDEAFWSFDAGSGTLTITGSSFIGSWYSSSGSPTGYQQPWADLADRITKVVVAEGITGLSNNTFAGHKSLTSVSLPKSLEYIGSGAFKNCQALTTIEIPYGVTDIYDSAFAQCTVLKSITIPATVTGINWNAFADCNALKNVYFGSTRTVWESFGCASYEPCSTATIHFTPAGICGEDLTWTFDESSGTLTISGKGAMYDYGSWEYGYQAPWFDYVETIQKVVVKSGVTSIGNFAFAKYNYDDRTYSALTSISLPSTLTAIGSYAFDGCTALKSITIPDSVKTLGNGVFRNCTALTKVTLGSKLTAIPQNAFSNCSKLRSITIPSGVTEIGSNAFSSCIKLDTVKLPSKLKTIGESAFSDCSHLESISIPSSVKTIGKSAFYNCSAITKITIPEGITAIEPYTFYSCGITKITIPSSVKTIGEEAFAYSKLTSVTVPDTVTSLGSYVFFDCDSLTTVTLSSKLKEIPTCAFGWCNNLKKITIPSSVTVIGEQAFSGCYNLTEITLPSKLKEICESAFRYTGLQKVVIPKNVKTIDYEAFANCNSLKVIQFKGDAPKIYSDVFLNVTADAIYPQGNSTWTSGVRKNYGGTIKWAVTYPLSVTPRVSDGKPTLTWGKVDGVKEYKIYRATSKSGSYKSIKTTTSTSYTDTSATTGKSYYYKVTTIFSNGTRIESAAVKCSAVLAAPKITITYNKDGNPVIKWKAVKDAVHYQVKRIDGTNIGRGWGTNQLSIVDTDAETGVTYQYQVMAYAQNNDYSSQYCDPVKATPHLPAPSIKLSSVSTGGIKISWSGIDDAKEYKVYRASSKSGSYKCIKTTSSTSYKDTSATAGKTYYYKVKAIHKDSDLNSAYSSVKSRMCGLAAPQVSIKLKSGDPKLTWKKVSGATKYTIYRATSKSGKYTEVKTTTSLSWTDTKASARKTYYYKVKAIHKTKDANSAYSSVVSIKTK